MVIRIHGTHEAYADSLWGHLGYGNLSSGIFTITVLRYLRTENLRVHLETVNVNGMIRSVNHWHFLALARPFDHTSALDMEIFLLDDSKTKVEEFTPEKVVVRACDDAASLPFWRPGDRFEQITVAHPSGPSETSPTIGADRHLPKSHTVCSRLLWPRFCSSLLARGGLPCCLFCFARAGAGKKHSLQLAPLPKFGGTSLSGAAVAGSEAAVEPLPLVDYDGDLGEPMDPLEDDVEGAMAAADDAGQEQPPPEPTWDVGSEPDSDSEQTDHSGHGHGEETGGGAIGGSSSSGPAPAAAIPMPPVRPPAFLVAPAGHIPGSGSVDIPPPPVPVAPRPPRPRGPKAPMPHYVPQHHWPTYFLPNFEFGKLVVDPGGRQVTAHCLKRGHGSNCKVSMVFSKRPMAYILSWLTDYVPPAPPAVSSQFDHAYTFKDTVKKSFTLRNNARLRYAAVPSLREPFALEDAASLPGMAAAGEPAILT